MNLERIRYPDGLTYEGTRVMGMRQGRGVLVAPDERRCEGDWENDLPHGRGTITYPDGSGYWLPVDEAYRPEIVTTVGGGWWLVDREIEPGIYRIIETGDWIYWARLSDFSGEYTGIIASQYLDEMPGDDFSITVEATDRGLALSGGSIWTRVGG